MAASRWVASAAFQDFSAEETVDGLAALSQWRRPTWWSGTR
ncbi:hypothetical protein OG923_32535 [Streptomyces halstedii]